MRRSERVGVEALGASVVLLTLVACQAEIQVLETRTSDADGGSLSGAGLRASSVASGQTHTCASRTGVVYCWGDNAQGSLGVGDAIDRLVPAPVGQDVDWVQVEAGQLASCARKIDGSVWCWGDNADGEAGDPTLAPVLEPRQVPLPSRASRVVIRFETACALLDDQTVHCWGDDYEGQLGQDDFFDPNGQPTPVPEQVPFDDWLTISTGQGHTCGIRASGELWCWGRNSTGELGLGPDAFEQIRTPTRVGDEADWVDISAGQSNTCGVRVDGSLWCWGSSGDSALPIIGPDSIRVPTLVEGASGWSSISVNTFGGCGLRSGSLWCWGRNIEGQLGTGDIEDRSVPTRIGTSSDWVSVSCGRFHTCARRADDTVWCTGMNGDGRLGVGDPDRRDTFTPVLGPGSRDLR